MNDLMLCSNLLADLYQTALTVSPQLFQKSILKLLEKVIGFDRAWWGIMSKDQLAFDLHSSYRYELPIEFEEHWQSVKDDDSLAFDAHANPRTTIHFNQKALYSTPGLFDLNSGHDLRHALCTSVFLPDKKSFLFISLFRSGVGAHEFSPDEIKLKQVLTPHLYACWRTNLLAEIERTRNKHTSADSATAFIDNKGLIIYAEASFGELINKKWPAWRGRQLPAQFLNMIESSNKFRSNESFPLYVDKFNVGGLFRLDVRKPSPLDKLTNREREIARGFSEARSYKEIAIETKLSPATVRHYLRLIYAKLEINDKAELVKIVDRFEKKPDLIDCSITYQKDFDFLGAGNYQ